MCKMVEYTNELFDKAEAIKEEWKVLNNQLSITDQKICDIEHFIEINSNLNAAEGYNAYRLLKEALEERRTIKNQIEITKPIIDFINGTQLLNPVKKKDLHKMVANKENYYNNEANKRQYRVRVLTEIFGDTLQKEA